MFANLSTLSTGDEDPQLKDIKDFLKAEGETITPQLIERMTRAFKSHRCALDFDKGFINACLKKDIDAIEKSSLVKNEGLKYTLGGSVEKQ